MTTTAVTKKPDPPQWSCGCQDTDLDRLRQLVAAGMDQREASRLIWSPGARPPASLAIGAPRAWAREFVRHSFATAFPWLRLPSPSEVSSQ